LTLSDSEIQTFRKENINGHAFLTLTADLLKHCVSIGKSAVLADLINNLNKQSKFYHKIVYRLYASRIIQQTSFKAVIFVVFLYSTHFFLFQDFSV
jgi:hypothetical protein